MTVSSIYQTEPLGYTDQPDFYNLILSLDSDLQPLQLLNQTRQIELNLGRKRDFVNCPRTIDIDIIAFNDQIINYPDLTVPHPRFQDRKFVLIPLAEIYSQFIDPKSYKSIQMLIDECSDQSKIKIVGVFNNGI
jgi:2-amino-4-hydroxy-6-hydroxymethyldihydropteridine diphosphokinase